MYTTVNRQHKDFNNFQSDFINTFKNYDDIILIDDCWEFKYKKFKDYFIIYSYIKNQLTSIRYYNYSDELHREDGPAFIWYAFNGSIIKKEYYLNGGRHREDGPSWIRYYENGEISSKGYYLNGEMYSYEDYLLTIKDLC